LLVSSCRWYIIFCILWSIDSGFIHWVNVEWDFNSRLYFQCVILSLSGNVICCLFSWLGGMVGFFFDRAHVHSAFSHTSFRCHNDTLRTLVSHTIFIVYTLCSASLSKPHLTLACNMSSGFLTGSIYRYGTYSWIIRVVALVLAEYVLCYGLIASNPIYINILQVLSLILLV
jgi:hypothetical protein